MADGLLETLSGDQVKILLCVCVCLSAPSSSMRSSQRVGMEREPRFPQLGRHPARLRCTLLLPADL